MTVRDIICEFSDSKLYPDLDQEVKLVYNGPVFGDFAGSEIPETGPALVKLRPDPDSKKLHRYVFSLKFEANPEIEANTFEEAEAKAVEMMSHVGVKNLDTDVLDESFVEQEPMYLEMDP